MTVVKFISDKNCQIFIDKELVGEITQDSMFKISLESGEYLVEAKAIGDNMCKKYILEIKDKESNKIQNVSWANIPLDDTIAQLRNDPTLKFYCDRATFCHEGKYGYINKKFEIVVKPIYSIVNNFSENKAFVVSDFHEGRKATLIDVNGNFYFDQWYDYVGESKTAILLGIDNKILVYSKRECNKIAEYYNAGYDYRQALVPVYRKDGSNNFYGFIDYDGNEVVPLIYDWINNFSANGFANVLRFGRHYSVDVCGNLFEFEDGKGEKISKDESLVKGFDLDIGYNPRKKDNKWGVLSTYGYGWHEQIRHDFDKLLYFNNNYCIIYKSDNYYYITSPFLSDHEICWTVDCEIDIITPILYDNGYEVKIMGLLAMCRNRYGIISIYGEVLLPIEYDRIKLLSTQDEFTNYEYVIIERNALFSVANILTGELLFPLEYSDVKPFLPISDFWLTDVSFTLMKNGKYCCMNINGSTILDLEYESITFEYTEIADTLAYIYFISKNNKNGIMMMCKNNMLKGYGGDEYRIYVEPQYDECVLLYLTDICKETVRFYFAVRQFDRWGILDQIDYEYNWDRNLNYENLTFPYQSLNELKDNAKKEIVRRMNGRRNNMEMHLPLFSM